MDYFVHPTAIIESDVIIGKETRIWHFVHIRSHAKIGKNCNLGKDVFIDSNVEIGDYVKIQNGVSLYQGIKVGDEVFIGPHAIFTNDLYPRAFNSEWKCVQTQIHSGASVGAGAIILCGITIGKYAMIGAGSVVTRDVPEHVLVFGNPAQIRRAVCKCGIPLEKSLGRVDKESETVKFQCLKCKEKISISLEIYNKIPDTSKE